MRHNKKFNHLGRKVGHRKALLSNLACSLILHKRITTTVAKAKALKMFVEPIITKSKEDSTANRRTAFSSLKNKYAVSELFREVSQKIANRPGGDAAEMCIIELVDYNETYTTAPAQEKKTAKTTRRGRTKKTESAPASAETVKEEKTEGEA